MHSRSAVPPMRVARSTLSGGAPLRGSTSARPSPAPRRAIDSVAASTTVKSWGREASTPAWTATAYPASPAKAPAVRTSPCANWMTLRTPKKSVKPMATRAYMSPSITPFITYWARRSMVLSTLTAVGGSTSQKLSLPGGVLAVLPDHPLAVLDHVGGDGGDRVLAVVVEGDGSDDGV